MTIGTTPILYDTCVSPFQLTGTVGVVRFSKNAIVGERYMLQTDLTAEVKMENDKYVVVDYQLDEYGIGNSLQEAQEDLLDSLVDYMMSLEKREDRLADRELHNLQILRNLLTKR